MVGGAASSEQLQCLVKEHSPYLQFNEQGRVVCTLNGHTCPPRLDVVASFVGGARYQALLKQMQAQGVVQQHAAFLKKSRNYEDMQYCALTCRLLASDADSVHRHVTGKKFLKAKERHESGKQQPMEEPLLEAEPSASGAAFPSSDADLDEADTRNGADGVDMEEDSAGSPGAEPAAGHTRSPTTVLHAAPPAAGTAGLRLGQKQAEKRAQAPSTRPVAARSRQGKRRRAGS